MDSRKFYFNLTIVISIVLFVSGIGILYYVNSYYRSTSTTTASNASVNNLLQPLVQSKEPFNILLMGGDKVNKNSDTMMLANFDPVTNKINIMSIPRDTKVKIEGKIRKINFAFPHGGTELAVQTVSELLDVNVKYFIFVDTAAFRDIIELLGGVNYYVPADLNYDDPTQNLHIHLKEGQQLLNGSKAEQFVRFRKPNKWTKEVKEFYDGSDLKRNEAQQNFMKELMRQKLNLQYLPKLTSIINAVFDNVETNLTLNEVIKMTGYIGKYKTENLNFIGMPGTTYDASPWYYLCDVAASRKIMTESFKCNGSFVEVDRDITKAYADNRTLAEPPPKKTPAKNTETTSGSSIKDNPSNSETSITGSDQDP
ncbi:MAG TPA: LCP family protein [Clostridia bacterium]|nr:LCP family protein [Clostridia bacterium]